ncbi:hypothetical protein [Dyella mobilis]|uniref:Uncharacterized protein n=1 Tax=Dyella mobilis TaxID=1849582 RepID=A0ABS2KK08_9GAMM|nr:hypothetical protein [Dyella mobilis]MBM7131496.1 hypothetical protein [Dyella mobilis]
MYEAKGYAPIGYSAFTAPSQQSESGAITQGKNVGADLVVVVSPEYVASKPVVAPVVSPGGSDSAMTGHADVPVTIKWFKYGALYFVKDESGKGTPPA